MNQYRNIGKLVASFGLKGELILHHHLGKKTSLKGLEVIEQPHQVLCRLEINRKEVLIPINGETLEKMDKKNKTVFVNLPDGLLELYLGRSSAG